MCSGFSMRRGSVLLMFFVVRRMTVEEITAYGVGAEMGRREMFFFKQETAYEI